VHGDDAVIAAAMRLNGLCGTHAILVTRGKDGMSLVPAGGRAMHLPARAREVFDVSGAGDTVISTFVAANAVGATLEDAAMLANVAAQIVVGKVGTAAVYTRNLIETLHAEDFTKGESKVVHLTTAVERVETWRRKGLRIGFTNGCFDLLHPGHLSLFKQAAARCDRLIVALNSDASIKRLKGPSRPIQNEAARSAVLASMDNIDLVIVFDEDTPYELLVALRPDVLVKGSDYRRDEVVGGDFVTSYGGKVFLARLENGHSTSRTIARIASIGELDRVPGTTT
jgi:D-beta-D-heptose 7-phosphate kinase/D-beta-D-heptose 1-phosphate adenosyltransferase